ncbi:MAG: DoxX family protein [Bacteroidota bacterium]|nr:DoxX family protein [Bacteroidota bacterium]
MRKLFSTRVSDSALSFALLLLRIGFGGLLAINSGWQKLHQFNFILSKWHSTIGLSSKMELSLVIFAEFFCAIFVVLGLFTRLALIPIIITMCVIVFKVNGGSYTNQAAYPMLLLIGFIALLFTGPGKVSLDKFIGK